MADDKRGFASMDDKKQRDIASKGGQASGGNFKNDSQRASDAGKQGAKNQSVEDKRRGGEHSHQND